jgi:hypothetical protein
VAIQSRTIYTGIVLVDKTPGTIPATLAALQTAVPAAGQPASERWIARLGAAAPYQLAEVVGGVWTLVGGGGATLYKGNLASLATLTALTTASLTAGDAYHVGDTLWVWDPAASSGSGGIQPNDTVLPGVSAGYWINVSGHYRGAYSASAPYGINEITYSNGELWRSNTARPAGVYGATPVEGVSGLNTWTKVTSPLKGKFNGAQSYPVGSLVFDDTLTIGTVIGIYRADVAFTAGAFPNPDDFTPIAVRPIYRGDYGPAEYAVGDVVHQAGVLYRCIVAHGSNSFGGPFIPANWTAIGGSGTGEVFPATDADIGQVAPAGAEIGWDALTGRLYYVANTGRWLAAKVGTAASPDGITYVQSANGQISFVVNGVPVGGVAIVGGIPKWTLNGALDPISYSGTPQTLAQRNALTPSPGWLVYVKDVGAGLNEYQLWDGTSWKTVGSAGAIAWEFTTNNITTVAGHSYIIPNSDTINLPAAPAAGAAIRFASPVEWSIRGATFTAPGATTVGAGQTGIIAGYDIIEMVYSATANNWVVHVGSGPSPYAIPVVHTADVGTVAPAGATLGYDPSTGDLFHVDGTGAGLWQTVPIGRQRFFLGNTEIGPAVPGAPTVAEVQAFTTPNGVFDTIAYYTGDENPSSPPTYVFHVDQGGDVTLVHSPDTVVFGATGTTPGVAGIVPTPPTGSQSLVLTGAGLFDSPIRPWTGTRFYPAGSVVSTQAGIWSRIADGTAAASFTPAEQANWTLLADINGPDTTQTLNATGTVTAWGSVVLIGSTPLTANTTITLPAASTGTGKTIRFVRVDNTAFTVTLAAGAGDTLTLLSAGAELATQNGSVTVEGVTSTVSRQVAQVSAGGTPTPLHYASFIGESGASLGGSAGALIVASTSSTTTSVVPPTTARLPLATIGALTVTSSVSGPTVSGNQLIIASTGRYTINGFSEQRGNTGAASNNNEAVQIVVNGAIVATFAARDIDASVVGRTLPIGWAGTLTAGDTVDIRVRRGGATDVDLNRYSIIVQQQPPYQVITPGSATIVDWTNYPAAFTGVTTAPTPATGATLAARYRAVGKNLSLSFRYFSATGTGATAGSGIYGITLPAGYSINTAVAPIPAVISIANTAALDVTPLGWGTASNGGAGVQTFVVPITATSVGVVLTNSTGGSNGFIGSGQFPMNVANYGIGFTVEIPIV